MQLTQEIVKLKDHQVLCREGDTSSDLYYVTNGSLLICARSGTKVTPIAYLSKGDYFGEMSFFDDKPRSADVISLEETTLIKVPKQVINQQFPTWLLVLARQMTKKLRTIDQVISDKGIRKEKAVTIKPLSIDEQRYLLSILNKND